MSEVREGWPARVFTLLSLGDVFSGMELCMKMVTVRMGVLSRSSGVSVKRRHKGICKREWWRQVLCSDLRRRR